MLALNGPNQTKLHMKETGPHNPAASINASGIAATGEVFYNASPEKLIEHSVASHEGILSDTGALAIRTGTFTGRSPKDKFAVEDDQTRDEIDWNNFNQPFAPEKFQSLSKDVRQHLSKQPRLYVMDLFAGADSDYRLNVRVIAEFPWSAHFANNMFLRPSKEELENFKPEWTVYCAPTFKATPESHGTRSSNFSILSFSDSQILIGGSGYTGEIKKGIFTVFNYILPVKHGVLPMHCSANEAEDGTTAIFFGLSGTGKTTLSADPERSLIGDDEHGWDQKGVFNFEGGCYAKTIDLTEDKEPDIFRAIRHGAILENIKFKPGTRTVDFSDSSLTENTRVSYPIYHIANAKAESRGGHPQNIFFLTCDAFGVLPPISRLSKEQAMYHFISGYTAKVAGTEAGISEPAATFSACFGAPFLPLHPARYAEMLGKQIDAHDVDVWLVNTGWSGGAYGTGKRINLKYTRAMVRAALAGELSDPSIQWTKDESFGLSVPQRVPGVPSELLDVRSTWADQEAYDAQAHHLLELFKRNFKRFASETSEEIKKAGPKEIVTS